MDNITESQQCNLWAHIVGVEVGVNVDCNNNNMGTSNSNQVLESSNSINNNFFPDNGSNQILESSSLVNNNNFFQDNPTNVISASSVFLNSTEDENRNADCLKLSKEEKRRAHNQAEQKRRDAIKKGYDKLQDLVPNCQQPEPGYKLSKAFIVQKSTNYLQLQLKKKKEEELERNKLRKEVMALRIMKTNYEKLLQAYQNQLEDLNICISDEIKFQVAIMDHLYSSFENVSAANFSELSADIFRWLEDNGNQQNLREIVMTVLDQFSNKTSS